MTWVSSLTDQIHSGWVAFYLPTCVLPQSLIIFVSPLMDAFLLFHLLSFTQLLSPVGHGASYLHHAHSCTTGHGREYFVVHDTHQKNWGPRSGLSCTFSIGWVPSICSMFSISDSCLLLTHCVFIGRTFLLCAYSMHHPSFVCGGWSSDSFSSILGFISSVSEPMSQPFSLHTPLSIWLLFHSFPCFTCQAQLDSVWPLFLLKSICFLPFTLSSCYHFLMSTTHCSTYCAIITSCQKCDFVLKLCVT